MTYRIFAASLVLLSGFGSMIASTAAGAASGALVATPSFHAGFHPPAFVHVAPAMASHRFFARGRDAWIFRRHEHREATFPLWVGGYDPYYYAGGYPPGGYPAINDEPSYPYLSPDVLPPERFGIHRPRCSTESQTVPSEKGGGHVINVTRCY
jgi:hypothetical protein